MLKVQKQYCNQVLSFTSTRVGFSNGLQSVWFIILVFVFRLVHRFSSLCKRYSTAVSADAKCQNNCTICSLNIDIINVLVSVTGCIKWWIKEQQLQADVAPCFSVFMLSWVKQLERCISKEPQRYDRWWVKKSTLWIRLRREFSVVNSSEVCGRCRPVLESRRLQMTHTHTHTSLADVSRITSPLTVAVTHERVWTLPQSCLTAD